MKVRLTLGRYLTQVRESLLRATRRAEISYTWLTCNFLLKILFLNVILTYPN